MSLADLAARVLTDHSTQILFTPDILAEGSAENPIQIDLSRHAMCTVAGGSDSFEKPLSILESMVPTASALLRSARLFEAKATPASNPTVGTSVMSFGDVKVNSSQYKYFNLNNSSGCPVNYSMTTPYGFSVSPSSGTISANSSASITVTFTPYFEQNYNGYINVTPGSASVSVSGRGVK